MRNAVRTHALPQRMGWYPPAVCNFATHTAFPYSRHHIRNGGFGACGLLLLLRAIQHPSFHSASSGTAAMVNVSGLKLCSIALSLLLLCLSIQWAHSTFLFSTVFAALPLGAGGMIARSHVTLPAKVLHCGCFWHDPRRIGALQLCSPTLAPAAVSFLQCSSWKVISPYALHFSHFPFFFSCLLPSASRAPHVVSTPTWGGAGWVWGMTLPRIELCVGKWESAQIFNSTMNNSFGIHLDSINFWFRPSKRPNAMGSISSWVNEGTRQTQRTVVSNQRGIIFGTGIYDILSYCSHIMWIVHVYNMNVAQWHMLVVKLPSINHNCNTSVNVMKGVARWPAMGTLARPLGLQH